MTLVCNYLVPLHNNHSHVLPELTSQLLDHQSQGETITKLHQIKTAISQITNQTHQLLAKIQFKSVLLNFKSNRTEIEIEAECDLVFSMARRIQNSVFKIDCLIAMCKQLSKLKMPELLKKYLNNTIQEILQNKIPTLLDVKYLINIAKIFAKNNHSEAEDLFNQILVFAESLKVPFLRIPSSCTYGEALIYIAHGQYKAGFQLNAQKTHNLAMMEVFYADHLLQSDEKFMKLFVDKIGEYEKLHKKFQKGTHCEHLFSIQTGLINELIKKMQDVLQVSNNQPTINNVIQIGDKFQSRINQNKYLLILALIELAKPSFIDQALSVDLLEYALATARSLENPQRISTLILIANVLKKYNKEIAFHTLVEALNETFNTFKQNYFERYAFILSLILSLTQFFIDNMDEQEIQLAICQPQHERQNEVIAAITQAISKIKSPEIDKEKFLIYIKKIMKVHFDRDQYQKNRSLKLAKNKKFELAFKQSTEIKDPFLRVLNQCKIFRKFV